MAFPFCVSRILSSADRTADSTRGATSNQSRAGKLSNSETESSRDTNSSRPLLFQITPMDYDLASLAEKIVGRGTKQIAGTSARRPVLKSSDDACGSAVELAADQSSRTGQFVGDRLKAGMQSIAVRIAASAIIVHSFHAGDADAEFHETLAPRTSECVSNK